MTRQRIAFLYRSIMSFYAPIPAILAIQLGWGAKAVGAIAALTSLGNLLSSYFWPRYAATARRAGVITLGFLGIILGAILLQNQNTLIPAVIIMSLVPAATYYFLLEGVRRQKGNLSKNVANFYQSESAGMLFGAILGAVSSYFLPNTYLSLVLLGVAILSILISVSSMKDVNLGPLPTSGVVEESLVTQKKLKKFGLRYVGEVGLTKKMLPYLFMSGLFSLSFALVYPQLPVIVETVFGNAALFYSLSILSRIFGTLAYKIAGNLNHKSIWVGWPVRLIASLLVAGAIFTKWSLLVFFILAGFGWAFIKTYYGIKNLESGEKLTSLNLTVRSLFYTIGSAMSGSILEMFTFVGSALISTAIFLIAPLWLFWAQKNLKQEASVKS
ncbi:MAG: MFS transporter [Candidatus Altiarchaeota archaeon]|nr:MFS transporter [Candidatus Altiarchaeota archaeon]